jgi:hypothetical protein
VSTEIVTLQQAYRFALDPSPAQVRAFRTHDAEPVVFRLRPLAPLVPEPKYSPAGTDTTMCDLVLLRHKRGAAHLPTSWSGPTNPCAMTVSVTTHRETGLGLRPGHRLVWPS